MTPKRPANKLPFPGRSLGESHMMEKQSIIWSIFIKHPLHAWPCLRWSTIQQLLKCWSTFPTGQTIKASLCKFAMGLPWDVWTHSHSAAYMPEMPSNAAWLLGQATSLERWSPHLQGWVCKSANFTSLLERAKFNSHACLQPGYIVDAQVTFTHWLPIQLYLMVVSSICGCLMAAN